MVAAQSPSSPAHAGTRRGTDVSDSSASQLRAEAVRPWQRRLHRAQPVLLAGLSATAVSAVGLALVAPGTWWASLVLVGTAVLYPASVVATVAGARAAIRPATVPWTELLRRGGQAPMDLHEADAATLLRPPHDCSAVLLLRVLDEDRVALCRLSVDTRPEVPVGRLERWSSPRAQHAEPPVTRTAADTLTPSEVQDTLAVLRLLEHAAARPVTVDPASAARVVLEVSVLRHDRASIHRDRADLPRYAALREHPVADVRALCAGMVQRRRQAAPLEWGGAA